MTMILNRCISFTQKQTHTHTHCIEIIQALAHTHLSWVSCSPPLQGDNENWMFNAMNELCLTWDTFKIVYLYNGSQHKRLDYQDT